MDNILQAGRYEQTLLEIAEKLPTYQRAQLLDYAILLKLRQISTAGALPIVEVPVDEERDWGRLAVHSLAKEWDTPEEDEAWAYLQEGM